MTSTHLPNEIWAMIFGNLHSDFSSLLAISVSCHRFRALVVPFLFDTIHLRLWPGERSPDHLLRASDILSVVKSIIVSNPQSTTLPGEPDMLRDLLERVGKLESVEWNASYAMPLDDLRVLHQKWPNVKLSMECNSADIHQTMMSLPSPRSHPLLEAKNDSSYSSCLHSLTIKWCEERHIVSFHRYCLDYCKTVKDLISSSPRLKILNLQCSLSTSRMPANEAPFTLHADDDDDDDIHFPAIEDLRLNRIYLEPGQASLWDRCMQWNRLKHLTLIDVNAADLLAQVSGKLPRLRSLEMRWEEWRHTEMVPLRLARFLESLPMLEACTFYDMPRAILHSLARYHGQRLRLLRWRSTRGIVPSVAILEDLIHWFPKLERLGVDAVGINNVPWSNDQTISISRSRSLHHLELHAPLLPGITSCEPNIQPSDCEALFKSIVDAQAQHNNNNNNKPVFETLEVRVGEWEQCLHSHASLYVDHRKHILVTRRTGGRLETRRLPKQTAKREWDLRME